MGGAWIVEQSAECIQADASFADMLMPVELRAACSLGVVTVPNQDVFQANRVLEILHRVLIAFRRNDLVSGNVGVAGVDAGRNWQDGMKSTDQLSYLFERTAQRILGAGCVLDKDFEAAAFHVKTVGRLCNRLGYPRQSFLTSKPAIRSGMQHEVLRA